METNPQNNAKSEILERLRRNTRDTYSKPELKIDAIEYPDPIEQFCITTTTTAGAHLLKAKKGDNINTLVSQAYPQAKIIASDVPGIHVTLNPNEVDSAQELEPTDVAVIQGEIGVAENGCIWVTQTAKERAHYFAAEFLVILLHPNQIVSNMHQAYKRLEQAAVAPQQPSKEPERVTKGSPLSILDSPLSTLGSPLSALNSPLCFGTFISGPSKTADIEQTLVHGAQAARGVTVILIYD